MLPFCNGSGFFFFLIIQPVPSSPTAEFQSESQWQHQVAANKSIGFAAESCAQRVDPADKADGFRTETTAQTVVAVDRGTKFAAERMSGGREQAQREDTAKVVELEREVILLRERLAAMEKLWTEEKSAHQLTTRKITTLHQSEVDETEDMTLDAEYEGDTEPLLRNGRKRKTKWRGTGDEAPDDQSQCVCFGKGLF